MFAGSLIQSLSNKAEVRRLPGLLKYEPVLFLFAFLVHQAAVLLLKGQQGSGLEWAVVAQNILTGKGFSFSFYGTQIPRYAFFPPFYPYFLAFSRTVLPAHWVGFVQLVQGVFFALGAVWVRRLASRFMRADLSLLAGYVVALWPPLVIYSIRLTPACFHAAAIPGLLLLLDDAVHRPGFWRSASAGAGYGVLGYSLPSFLGSILLLPFAFRHARWGWGRAFAAAAQVLVAAMLVLLPWTARNMSILHRFVPVATNLGFNLLGSQNAYASSSYNVLCLGDTTEAKLVNYDELSIMNEADFDGNMFRQGLSYMFRHPLQTAQRSLTRILFLWWANPHIIGYSSLEGASIMVLMSVLFPLFLLGLFLSFGLPCKSTLFLVYCVLIWQTLFYMNFAVRGRYSLELYPLMIVFAILSCGAIMRWRASGSDLAVTKWGR